MSQWTTRRGAAFFDLDKTILSTSASVALRHALVDAGLINRRAALMNTLLHLPYLVRGADNQTMEHICSQLTALIIGWDGATLEATVQEALHTAIDPVVFSEALEQIALHRAAGQPVVIASASLEQMVRPIGKLLGADYVIGTRAQLDDDGAFTGELESFNYSTEKAQACARLAEEHGWPLEDSFAYSDSETDIPLLELVGHPVAVNPDAALRALALERGWQILSFGRVVRVRATAKRAVLPVALTGAIAGVCAATAWKLWASRSAGL